MTLKKNGFKIIMLLLLPGTLTLASGCSKNDAPVGSAPVSPVAPSEVSAATPSAPSGTFSGTVSLDPKLAGKIDPNAVLFISAKPSEGPQMGVPPVASQRIASPKFPVQYTLSQADVIMPGATLSGQFNVVAKLMKNGAAGPVGPGDIEGKFPGNPVAAGGKAVDITLDTLH